MTNQRVMTSAIPGVSVAEIRKALQQVRDRWRKHSPETPIYLTETLFNDMTIEQFAFLFVLGNHVRRHHKCASAKRKRT